MGHALNKTIKDIIVRYKSMAGFRSPYVPGWDTHGLPIETAIAKKGVKRKEMSIAEFRKLCAEYAMKQVDGQRTGFKRLGINGDWENPYITLLPEYEAEQIKVFGEMAKKGYIYKGKNQYIGLLQVNLHLQKQKSNIKIKHLRRFSWLSK